MKNNKIKVSVIIPTYKRDKELVNIIRSVLEQKFQGFELIVVDQTIQHNPETMSYLKNLEDSRFRYFLVTPPSLPAARNFGLKKAHGGIVIFIDDDVILTKDFTKAHWESYITNPKLVSVAGRIKSASKPLSKELAHFDKANLARGGFDYPHAAFVQTCQGANMSFKRSILLQINGFDTNYMGNAVREESDVCFRLARLGHKILYNPQAILKHLELTKGGCGEDGSAYANYLYYRNEMYFFLKYRNWFFLPYFLSRYFRRFIFKRKFIHDGIFLPRTKAFIKGNILGILILLHPKKEIISQEIKE